jgi:hypothetical protein
MADNVGKATQTSVTTPAMTSWLRPVSFHGGDELLVVPGVDLPRTCDAGSVGKPLLELGDDRPVRAVLEARREDRR